MGILKKLFRRKEDTNKEKDRCITCGELKFYMFMIGNECTICSRKKDAEAQKLYQEFRENLRKAIKSREERKMKFYDKKLNFNNGRLSLTLNSKGESITFDINQFDDLMFIIHEHPQVLYDKYFKNRNTTQEAAKPPKEELISFFPTRLYTEFTPSFTKLSLKDNDNVVVLTVPHTDKAEKFFIENCSDPLMVAEHFKEQIKWMGYEVKAPEPDKLCNRCGKYYFKSQMSIIGLCIYCKKDQDDCNELRQRQVAYAGVSFAGGTFSYSPETVIAIWCYKCSSMYPSNLNHVCKKSKHEEEQLRDKYCHKDTIAPPSLVKAIYNMWCWLPSVSYKFYEFEEFNLLEKEYQWYGHTLSSKSQSVIENLLKRKGAITHYDPEVEDFKNHFSWLCDRSKPQSVCLTCGKEGVHCHYKPWPFYQKRNELIKNKDKLRDDLIKAYQELNKHYEWVINNNVLSYTSFAALKMHSQVFQDRISARIMGIDEIEKELAELEKSHGC